MQLSDRRETVGEQAQQTTTLLQESLVFFTQVYMIRILSTPSTYNIRFSEHRLGVQGRNASIAKNPRKIRNRLTR